MLRPLMVLLIVLAASACAPRYTLRRVEHVGPVPVEIWHDKQTQQCERRVYLDGYAYRTVVPCP